MIDRIDIGEELGWNIGKDGLVEVSFGTAMASDGRPCITLQYHVAPRYKYYKLMQLREKNISYYEELIA